MFRDGSTWFLPLTELPVHWGEREMYKPVVIMPLVRVITDTHTGESASKSGEVTGGCSSWAERGGSDEFILDGENK